ncbi:MAG: type II toxin-antitoxin system HipA family toxin [Deltaproteobacteria bacterium]|nr:type II toxin-antitoxin system HipA family toxin [Deltaproteobacteria bacterium]MBT7205136.1 type II toxin-antitoxin system HipA family toxin [Deltaproteobacteria bacterium]
MTSKAYVTLMLPGQTSSIVVGHLHIEQTGHDVLASFVYGRNYCEHPAAIPLDPLRLPLDPNRRFEAPGLWGVLGIFRDASPDYWGRLVMEREMRSVELLEMDYLLHSGPTRIGALGFQEELESEPAVEKPVNLISLPALLEASSELEANKPIDDKLMLLLRQGTSIGGARPKATAVEDNLYWLAKFSSKQDRLDMPLIEYATLRLAASAGIQTPEFRLLTLEGSQHVVMTRRFDRKHTPEGWCRYHYMSGLTVLGLNEFENSKGGYPELADSLRLISTNFKNDAVELFRRMVFNILISNDDDHLRNHAFIHLLEGWCLSPAYDLVPHPQVGYQRFQSIIVGKQGREGSLGNALSEAGRFGLTDERAKDVVEEVLTVVGKWREYFTDAGVSEAEIELLQTAFLPESALRGYEPS